VAGGVFVEAEVDLAGAENAGEVALFAGGQQEGFEVGSAVVELTAGGGEEEVEAAVAVGIHSEFGEGAGDGEFAAGDNGRRGETGIEVDHLDGGRVAGFVEDCREATELRLEGCGLEGESRGVDESGGKNFAFQAGRPIGEAFVRAEDMEDFVEAADDELARVLANMRRSAWMAESSRRCCLRSTASAFMAVLLTTMVLPLMRIRTFMEGVERGALVLCLP